MKTSNFYFRAQSDDKTNLDYFPNNTAHKFKIHLSKPLNLSGIWKIALCDIHINDSKQISYMNQLYVFCSIVDTSILNGRQEQHLLRSVELNRKGNWTNIYHQLYYENVNKTHIFDIEIYITDRSLRLATFLTKPLTITLHFRQYPFFL